MSYFAGVSKIIYFKATCNFMVEGVVAVPIGNDFNYLRSAAVGKVTG